RPRAPNGPRDPARDRFITPSLACAGRFEPFPTALVVNTVRPGDVALDPGAHVGLSTLLPARPVVPTGRVLPAGPGPEPPDPAVLQRRRQRVRERRGHPGGLGPPQPVPTVPVGRPRQRPPPPPGGRAAADGRGGRGHRGRGD